MKKYAPLYYFLLLTLVTSLSFAEQQVDSHTVLQEKIKQAENPATQKKNQSRRKKGARLINFYFDNEDLVDIINYLAAQREINVVLPMGANTINAKVTLHLEEKVTLEEAWDMLYTLLDLSGYSMIAQENMYRIVKTSKEVVREPLPLYVVKPSELPNNDKRIRYLYYFTNIKVAEDPNNEIVTLLRDVLPDVAWGGSRLDSLSNSVLITDKANNIKALMDIVVALDHAEAQERPEIIRLRHLSADTVANLFNDMLKSSADTMPARPDLRKVSPASYFSRKLKIVPDMRNNSLIVFGRPQAVERVREFIDKYIDIELESGRSILHIYQLQYLDAQKFKPVLEGIVKSTRTGGTEQSKAGAVTPGGTERFFDEVVISADYPRNLASGEQPGGAMAGSNNLIIAARTDDWERIKKLIEELDTPQPQVIIEVLIADLTLVDQRALGMSLRNPLGTGLPNNVNFQSAQFTPVLTNSVSNPATIASDLLRLGLNTAGQQTADCDTTTTTTTCVSAARTVAPGTTMLSFNDTGTGQTWGLLQIRNFIDNQKILTHPHLITTNNKKAKIVVEDQKLLVDEASGSTGGTTTQTRKWIPAKLSVVITPRISAGGMVNLNVVVDIDQFANSIKVASDASAGNRITRNVTTNANVRSGNVLVLGGLTRVDSSASQNETPLLGRLPLIGWLFKNRTAEIDKNNLTVFISPIIIEPRLRGGVSQYTKEYVQLAKSFSYEGMVFDNLRDPITRWFFKPQAQTAAAPLDEFVSQDEYDAPTIFDTRKEDKKTLTRAEPPSKPKDDTKSDDLKSLVGNLEENPFLRV